MTISDIRDMYPSALFSFFDTDGWTWRDHISFYGKVERYEPKFDDEGYVDRVYIYLA